MNFVVVAVIISSLCVLFQSGTSGDDETNDATIDTKSSLEVLNAIRDPQMRTRVHQIMNERKIAYARKLNESISAHNETKAALNKSMYALRQSFFSLFACAILSMKADLELCYKKETYSGVQGYNVGGEELPSARIYYPEPTPVNGLGLAKLNFPRLEDQKMLFKCYLKWVTYVRKNPSEFAENIREKLKEFANKDDKLEEIYKDFSFAMSRTYRMSYLVAQKCMDIGNVTDNQGRRPSLEEWLEYKMPGGWFFPKEHLDYMNLLLRALGKINGGILGIQYVKANKTNVIPYANSNECPTLEDSNYREYLRQRGIL